MGAFYLLLVALDAHICSTRILARIPKISGYDFEITETDCDAIAKESWISVFASKQGDGDKTLLFKYDPIYYEPIPEITPLDGNTAKISVPKIAVLLYQRDKWQSLRIHYDIRAIVFPHDSPPSE